MNNVSVSMNILVPLKTKKKIFFTLLTREQMFAIIS